MYERLADEAFADLAETYDTGYAESEAFEPTPPPPGTTLLTHFAFASAALTASHRATIARIAADILRRMPATPGVHCVFVDAEGHEDEVGDPARFGQLGLDRALAVAQRLATLLNARIPALPAASRRHVHVDVTTAGPTRPIRSNVTAAGRAMNRRVELRMRVDMCPGMV